MSISSKTAPCLLQELIGYDPRSVDDERTHQTCHHVYSTVAERSVLPAPEDTGPPTTGTEWKVSSLCQQCRCHLELVLSHPGPHPCPSWGYPLHHFLFGGQDFGPDRRNQNFNFECSSPNCNCKLVVQFRLPSLTHSDVSYLIHPASLKSRLEKLKDRGEDRTSLEASETLGTFRSYIRDSIENKSDKRIPARNKKFIAALGEDAHGLLARLGFAHQQADDGSENMFWRLPNPTEPSDSNLKVRLQDAFDELNLLIQQRPEVEKQKFGHSIFSPPPSTQDIQRCMGALDYEKHTSGRNLRTRKSQDTWSSYTILGGLSNFADSLISFCYDRQINYDPDDSPKYFQALKEIANARQSEALEEKAMLLESQGQQSQDSIDAAYHDFGIDINHLEFVNDEHILGIFNSRLPDVGDHEKQRVKRSLMTLGHARKSPLLLNAASERVETYEDALSFLGIDQTTADEFVVSTVAVKDGEGSQNVHLSRKAVEIIAEKRQSPRLRQWLQGGDLPSGDVNLQQAYSLFSITEPSQVDDEQIVDSFTVAVSDNPSRKDEFQQALSTVAEARGSATLKRFLSEQQLGPSTFASETPLYEPRGLKNIGNTCYLNSLLQYFFTIRGVRELLANFESYKEDMKSGSFSKKKVGGVLIRPEKIKRAQDFAVELHGLFDSLVKERDIFVMPKEELARLTLVNVVGETNRRRSTITGISVKATSPILPSKQPAIIRENTKDPDYDMMPQSSQDDSMDTSQSAPGPVGAKEGAGSPTDPSNNVSHSESSIQTSFTSEPMDLDPTIQPGSTATQNATTSGQQGLSSAISDPPTDTSQPPPIPPRPGDSTSRADYEEFAQQQDVQEVIENVLDQIRWAIKPERVEEDEEQVDVISRLFYGKENYTIASESPDETKLEPFYYLIVYLNAGPCDLYGAIDAAFDLNRIEDSSGRAQFKTIQSLPPILQFRVPRVGFDPNLKKPFKVDHQLKLYDEIYMDRYMDDEDMLSRRKESWALNEELDTLRADRAMLNSTTIDLDAPESLQAMRRYLSETLSEDQDETSSVDRLSRWLQDEAGKARQKLEQVNLKISELELAKSRLFPNQGKLKYRLHAVFVHRGESDRGHWFIYINDPECNSWRQYNDEAVTTVTDTSAIFEPDSSRHGTSAFVVYVRDDVRNQVIETVRREPAEPPSDLKSEEDTVDSGRPSSGALPERESWDFRETDDRDIKW